MRISYRPEIDGLRAISIFAIILYHANFIFFGHHLFQGAFVGVDIFFVISGYLITTLILKEIVKNNQFSFKYFYERRIRRILPVLLFVIIITSILSYFILLPLSLVDFAKSVLSTISFGSNFYFWSTDGRYGDETELLKPLLHTWSLSVEEQFYILFPIFLIIVIKFFRKHLLTVLFLSFLISLFFSEYCSRTHPSFNFYMILSRGFELLTGSLLSYFELNNGGRGRKSYSILNQICPSLGVILIIYSFLFFNLTKIFHPSFITLIPLIGVSLIIWFSKKGGLITEILSSKIFVFFGLISYSLYLWHYPIFAFLRYIDIFNNSIWIKLLAVLLTIILSIISYYLIERPFRNKNIISIKTLTTYILVSVIVLLSYSFYIIKTEGIKSRFPNIIFQQLREDLNQIQYNKKGTLGDVFLVGDSHSRSLKFYLNEELEKNHYNFYENESSFYLPNFYAIDRKTNIVKENYLKNNENISKFLQENKNLIVILHYRWALKLLETRFDNEEGYKDYDNDAEKLFDHYFIPLNIKDSSLNERINYRLEALKATINDILNQDHILIIVYPVPEMGFDVPRMALKNYTNILDKLKTIKNNPKIPILTNSYDVYKKRNKIVFETLDSIHHPNIYRVYPDKIFCDTMVPNRCVANDKDNLFYRDHHHLSLAGSKYVVNDIIKIIHKVKPNKNN